MESKIAEKDERILEQKNDTSSISETLRTKNLEIDNLKKNEESLLSDLESARAAERSALDEVEQLEDEMKKLKTESDRRSNAFHG